MTNTPSGAADLPDEVVRLAQVAIRECQYKGNDMPQDWMESAMRACRLIAASHGQAPAETGNSVSAQADSVLEDAAWMPITPELLTAIESGDHGARFWIAGPGMTEPWVGEYEWLQGRVPHGFNTQRGRMYPSEITHVLPYKPPALPAASSPQARSNS